MTQTDLRDLTPLKFSLHLRPHSRNSASFAGELCFRDFGLVRVIEMEAYAT